MNNLKDKERRRFERIKKNLHVQCGPWNTIGIWSSVVMQDISETGMSFLGNKRFKVDGLLEIRITTFIKRGPISIKGTVVELIQIFLEARK